MLKKSFRKMAVLLAIVMSMGILAGCNKPANTEKDAGKKGSSYDITVMTWTPSDEVDNADVVAKYKEKFGGNVKYKIIDSWMSAPEVLATSLASGEKIDVIYMGVDRIVSYATKNMVIPINDVFDLDDPLFRDYKAIYEGTQVNGKNYCVIGETTPSVLAYNKRMLENNGIKSPREYYKEGNWNWDTFREICMKLTKDTTGDGNINQYGYASWEGMFYVFSNNTDFVKKDAEGKIVLNLDDPKLTKSLQATQDALLKDKYYLPTSESDKTFTAGDAGFAVCRLFTNESQTLFQDADFDWGIIPFPQGPDSDGVVKGMATMNFYGIGSNANSIDGASEYIKMMFEKQNSVRDKYLLRSINEEDLKLYNELRKQAGNPEGTMAGINYSLVMNDIMSGANVTATLNKYKPVYADAMKQALGY